MKDQKTLEYDDFYDILDENILNNEEKEIKKEENTKSLKIDYSFDDLMDEDFTKGYD